MDQKSKEEKVILKLLCLTVYTFISFMPCFQKMK